MFEVDTVFSIATSRGPYIAHDLIKSIRWSCTRPNYIVIVDRGGDVPRIPELADGYTLLTTDPHRAADPWLAGLGLKWAVDVGIQAKYFVVLSDECLILQQGIDAWALEHAAKTQVGLLGVRDRLNYDDAYKKCTPWFDMWDLPHTNYEPSGETVHDAAVWMSSSLVSQLFSRNLLPPNDCEQWPLPYGPFISWAAQMLGFYQVGWGHMDKRIPPLFVNHTGRSRHMPEPHVLHPQFALYYSARRCAGYSEEDLREAYKRQRGEPARSIEPFRPVVSPKPDGPTEAG